MTQISRDEVQRLAVLSNLKLSDDEVESLQADLGNILDYVKQLNELTTDSVEPAYQVTGLNNVMREDVVADDPMSREKLLALAPDSYQSQIKVPKVL